MKKAMTPTQHAAATLYFTGSGSHCAEDQNASIAAATINMIVNPYSSTVVSDVACTSAWRRV
jgi:hypothetical protein